MKTFLFSLSLTLAAFAVAAEPSFTCSVTREIPTGEKPIFETVVQPFTVYGAQAGLQRDVSPELKVYCQATVPIGGDAGNVQCDFYRGPGYFQYSLAHAYAMAMPASAGFPGSLLLTIVDYNATDARDRARFSVSCKQN